jgi:benzoyl-CoA reductase subunit D
MITVGVDVGAETIKVVIVKDDKVLSSSMTEGGMDREQSADQALDEAMASAGITKADIERVVATGIGRKEIAWANDTATDIAAVAMGANHFFPSARTVIDIGAEESRCVKIDGLGRVVDFAKNDKCAAGVGTFVESMARALEMKLEEMGPLSLQSDTIVPMNVTCVVFAESEVVSLIHSGIPKPDITRSIHEAIATRAISTGYRVGIDKDVALVGGLVRNSGVVDRLSSHLGMVPLLPEEPQLVSALGAALIAAS